MTPAELRAEILSGPLAADLAAFAPGGAKHATGESGLSWAACVAARLNAPRPDRSARRQPVPRRDIKERVLARGKLVGILASADPAAVAVRLLFSDPDFSTVNTDSPVWLALVAGLVAAGLLGESDAAAVAALADVSPASRAAELGWPAVTESDVAAAFAEGV